MMNVYVGGDNEKFLDIAGDPARQFVCKKHSREYCQGCMLDFGILNAVRRENDYDTIEDTVDEFFSEAGRPDASEHLQRLSRSVTETLSLCIENNGMAMSDAIELAGHLTFVAHDCYIDGLEYRIDNIMRIISEKLFEKNLTYYAFHKKQKGRAKRMAIRADQDLMRAYDIVFDRALELTKVCDSNGIVNKGTGFPLDRESPLGRELVQGSRIPKELAQVSIALVAPKAVRDQYEAANFDLSVVVDYIAKESQEIRERSEPEEWSGREIIEFLNEFGMLLRPMPCREVLNEIISCFLKIQKTLVAMVEDREKEMKACNSVGEDIWDRICLTCGEKGTLTCSSCTVISYCCVECQQEDWQRHKPFCKREKKNRLQATNYEQIMAGFCSPCNLDAAQKALLPDVQQLVNRMAI